jgi:hypothetical protein
MTTALLTTKLYIPPPRLPKAGAQPFAVGRQLITDDVSFQ